MSSTILSQIQSVVFAHHANPETIEDLGRGAFSQVFPEGVELTEEGRKSDFAYVLTEGLVEQSAGLRQATTTLGVIKPSQAFGIVSAIMDEPSVYTARTLCQARVLMIPATSLRQAAANDAGLATGLLRYMSASASNMLQQLKEQKLCSSIERLAAWVLDHNRDAETARLPFNKRTLAGLIGTTPENLSRSISQLRSHGVDIGSTHVRVLDRGALERLAGA